MYNKSSTGKKDPVTLSAFNDGHLPEKVTSWAGMGTSEGVYKAGHRGTKKNPEGCFEYNLANLNDLSKKGFKYIAGVIQKHVKDL